MRRAVVVWGVLLVLAPEPLQALTYTNETAFLAAHPMHELAEFEGVPEGTTAPAPSFADFTVMGTTPTSAWNADGLFTGGLFPCPCPAGVDGDDNPLYSDFLYDDSINGSLTIQFNAPVTAVGFRLAAGDQPGLMNVAVYRDAMLLEGLARFDVVDLADFSTFVGFADLGPITSVRVWTPNLPLFQWVNLDKLRFVSQVPEPAPLLLVVLGLAALANRGSRPGRGRTRVRHQSSSDR